MIEAILSLLHTVIIYPLYTIIEFVYVFCNRISNNYGLSVIGVSVGVSLLCLPLYAVAEHWQEIERKTEARLKPGLDRIKMVFTGDERYMITAAYYRENHYTPIMALRSSFGLLIQIPFFIAAYQFLSQLEDLRGESFLFIRDMGSPDALFHIGQFPVNVLPVAMTLINIIAGTIYTRGHPFKEKLQIYGMALLFLIILYSSPSGLVLYWTMNNVFSLVKNIFYRLRHPRKVFWICICLLCLPAFFLVQRLQIVSTYRLYFFAAIAIVFLLPLIIKGRRFFFASSLRGGADDARSSLALYVASCVLLLLLNGLAIPSSLIASSPLEFSSAAVPNPLGHLPITFCQAAGLFLFWPVCVYLLFNTKIKISLSLLLSIGSLGALLNTYVFMLPYGDISSSLVFLNIVNFRTVSSISAINIGILLVLCICISYLFLKNKKNIIFYGIIILCTAEALISIKNLIQIYSQYTAYTKNTDADKFELEPIFHLSTNKQNVVLFMLDAAQGQFIEEIIKESPELNDIYEGFVFYNNTVSFNGHTMIGAPGIYGGYEYTPNEMNKRSDILLKDKNNEAELLLPRLFTEEKGFSAVTTDPSWGNYSIYPDLSAFAAYPDIHAYRTIGTYASRWYASENNADNIDSNLSILKRNMLFFSIFRSAPIFLREAIYYKGKYWNSNEELQDFQTVINNYSVLDFLPELTAVSETDNGSYTCIVNELTHCALFLQAPDYTPVLRVTNRGTSLYKDEDDYSMQMAAIKRIGTWLRFLKKHGAYNNTRIIIASDHGRWGREADMEPDAQLDAAIHSTRYRGRGHYHCLLMYKDFNTSGPLVIDNSTFMTNADVPSLALRGIIDKPENPFTGKPIPLDTVPLKEGGVLITTCDNYLAWLYQNSYTYDIKDDEWWLVKDNIFSAKNWTQIQGGVK